jgi:hypothetical protein
MDQPQSQTQAQSSEPIRVNPLQILVNAAIIGYQRGAFSMKETSIISQSIDFFVETKQAVLPQPQTQPVQPTPQPPQQPQPQVQVPQPPQQVQPQTPPTPAPTRPTRPRPPKPPKPPKPSIPPTPPIDDHRQARLDALEDELNEIQEAIVVFDTDEPEYQELNNRIIEIQNEINTLTR